MLTGTVTTWWADVNLAICLIRSRQLIVSIYLYLCKSATFFRIAYHSPSSPNQGPEAFLLCSLVLTLGNG